MFNDGVVDIRDAQLFAWAIRDEITYNEMFILSGFTDTCPDSGSPSGYCGAAPESLADIDGDTMRTFADIPAFLDLVEQSGGNAAAAWNEIVSVFDEGAPVPEPTTLWLALAALGSVGSIRHCR